MADTGVVAIDFGTTTTLAAERTPTGPAFHPVGRGTDWLPSIVAIDDSGQLVVGEDAEMVERSRLKVGTARWSVKGLITSGKPLFELTDADGVTRQVPVDDAVAAVLTEAWKRASRQVRAGDASERV